MVWPFTTKAKKPKRVAPTIPFVGGDRWLAGIAEGMVTPESAQALSAVLACVNLISESIGSLPATVTLADDSRREQPDHPLSRLIATGCNANQTWADLLTSFVSSALLHGNGIIEQTTDDRGKLAALTTVAWPTCTPWVSEGGELNLDVFDILPPRGGQKRTLLREDFALLKDRGDDALLGVSRLSRAGNVVQLALGTQTNVVQFMANAARPAGTLTSPGRVSPETADRLAKDWGENYKGERVGRVAVLPDGLKWEPLSQFSAEDQQIVERLRYTVEDISRIYNVPLFLLGDPNRATYATATAAGIAFARSLLPWVTKIEAAFAQTILSRQYRLRLDIGALIKSDPEATANALSKYRAAGILSPNDARREIGYPAVADGDSIEPPVAGGKPVSATDMRS